MEGMSLRNRFPMRWTDLIRSDTSSFITEYSSRNVALLAILRAMHRYAAKAALADYFTS